MKRRTRNAAAGLSSEERGILWIAGAGRLGGALARALDEAGWSAYGIPRNNSSLRRWRELGVPIAEPGDVSRVRVLFLAVPDDKVEETAAHYAKGLRPVPLMVHCAGALPHSGVNGSFHPLVAISHPEDSLAGAAVAISASTDALGTLLAEIAQSLDLRPLQIPESQRSLYHAGAVLAAGGVVATLSAAVDAWRALGISEKDALQALLPLTRSALRGVEQRGLAKGLTGPIVRQDTERVLAHWNALPAHLRPLYAALSQEAIRMLGVADGTNREKQSDPVGPHDRGP